MCSKCCFSWTNEYPNVFVSAKCSQMNVQINLFDYIFYEWRFEYICPCSTITNEYTNLFEEQILTKYFCKIKEIYFLNEFVSAIVYLKWVPSAENIFFSSSYKDFMI